MQCNTIQYTIMKHALRCLALPCEGDRMEYESAMKLAIPIPRPIPPWPCPLPPKSPERRTCFLSDTTLQSLRYACWGVAAFSSLLLSRLTSRTDRRLGHSSCDACLSLASLWMNRCVDGWIKCMKGGEIRCDRNNCLFVVEI